MRYNTNYRLHDIDAKVNGNEQAMNLEEANLFCRDVQILVQKTKQYFNTRFLVILYGKLHQ